ncbi:MAG: AbrB/MazE/SpoVT family DNA-binding domain-containing protein [Zoogloeaceae bacterium]|nr:AbrB/MazE/SpoVT family DNA-binding domain-containing protein [Zoogloeaceae bacterium]
MRVAKWGNSLAVRLPASLVKELDLREGVEVEIAVRRKDKEDKALIAQLRKFRGMVPAGFKFDRAALYEHDQDETEAAIQKREADAALAELQALREQIKIPADFKFDREACHERTPV